MEQNNEQNNSNKENKINYLAIAFDWLTELFEGSSKPMFTFISVAVPLLSPYVMAKLTALALVKYKYMDASLATVVVIVLEGIGIVGLSAFVLALVSWIKSKNPKTMSLIYLLGIIDILYFLTIVSINVILDASNGASGVRIMINILLCLLPVLSGGIFGHYRITLEDKEEKISLKEIEERRHQEQIDLEERKRKDKIDLKLKLKGLDKGINVFQSQVDALPLVSETGNNNHSEKTKYASDYKDKVLQMLDEVWETENRVLKPSEITERVNKKYRTSFSNTKAKGFWSQTTSDWKLKKGI